MEKLKDVKIAIVVSALQALDYMNVNRHATIEEVIRHVMWKVYSDNEIVMRGIIASANFTYNYKMKNYKLSNKKVVQEVLRCIDEIIFKIDDIEVK